MMTIDKEQLRDARIRKIAESWKKDKPLLKHEVFEVANYIITALDEGRVVEWLPISSAPKDGTAIRIKLNEKEYWSKYIPYSVGRNLPTRYGWMLGHKDDGGLKIAKPSEPTHWTPLPKPPTTERED